MIDRMRRWTWTEEMEMNDTAVRPALTEMVPFANPEWADEEQPDFAEASMMGQCPKHGLERITDTRVGGGSDPTQLYFFACGELDPRSFG